MDGKYQRSLAQTRLLHQKNTLHFGKRLHHGNLGITSKSPYISPKALPMTAEEFAQL
jgi:hypothetical protein